MSALERRWRRVVCGLIGRHDPGLWGTGPVLFVRCVHCGWRSNGLSLH